MPAEWQARQLLLSASAPGPWNIRSPNGRSTLTDFRTNLSWAWAAGARAQRRRQTDRQCLAEHVLPLKIRQQCVCSMTLRMNPLGFQLGASGCVSPLLLVQRTISTDDPLGPAGQSGSATGGSCTCLRPCRAVLAASSCRRRWRSRRAIRPYRRRTRCRARVSGRRPAALSPGLMLVMKERGTMRLIGTDLTPVCPGWMLAWGVSGMV